MYQFAELRKQLERQHAGHLLDVATGEGDFLFFLLESFATFDSATGLDINQESLSKAKEKLAQYKIDFVHGNIRKLPFEDNYFDTVTVSNSLHHFELPVKAIANMSRVLAPGGLLLINEMVYENLNPAQQNHFDYHSLKAEIDTARGTYHRKIYTMVEMLQILAEANLEIDSSLLIDSEMPILNSREKMWQFSRKIDDMISSAANLPNGQQYEERANLVKEHIAKEGFQIPPQMVLLTYKS